MEELFFLFPAGHRFFPLEYTGMYPIPVDIPLLCRFRQGWAGVFFHWQVTEGLNNNWALILGLLLPLLGTTLGAGMVFFMKGPLKEGFRKALLGFAAGVMIASSIFSLLLPSIDMAAAAGGREWLPAAVGVPGGVVSFLLLDAWLPHLRQDSGSPEGARPGMLVLAATLCNIPDGMAMGVVLAGLLLDGAIPAAGALTLAFGIAIQNFPEGAVISMPLADGGMKKKKAMKWGFLSGAVEPVGAGVTIALTSLLTPVLPYILAFAAGAMLYVVVAELIPEAQCGSFSAAGTLGTALGFTLMVVLDTALR